MARAPVFLCSLSCPVSLVSLPPSLPSTSTHLRRHHSGLDNKFVSWYYFYNFYLILSLGIAWELMEHGRLGRVKIRYNNRVVSELVRNTGGWINTGAGSCQKITHLDHIMFL